MHKHPTTPVEFVPALLELGFNLKWIGITLINY